jgi:tetratricopeptide (TPR) repeat protein
MGILKVDAINCEKGRIFMKTNEKEIERVEEKIRHGSDDFEEYMTLREFYFASGQYDKLLNVLHQILTTFRLTGVELAGIYLEIGDAFRILDRLQEAADFFQKSLQILQKNMEISPKSLYLKAMNHYKLFYCLPDEEASYHHAREAITAFQKVIQHPLEYEDQYQSYTYLAGTYAQLGEYDNALYFHQAALEFASTPEDRALVLTGIAALYGKKREWETAVRYFEEALQQAGDVVPTAIIYWEFGRMYFEAEQFAKADQMLQEALKRLGDDPELRVNPAHEIEILWHLGTSAYREHDFENAIRYLTDVLEKIDDEHYYYADSHLTLGDCYRLLEDYEKALEHCNYVLTSSLVSDEQITLAKECLERIPSGKYHVH